MTSSSDLLVSEEQDDGSSHPSEQNYQWKEVELGENDMICIPVSSVASNYLLCVSSDSLGIEENI